MAFIEVEFFSKRNKQEWQKGEGRRVQSQDTGPVTLRVTCSDEAADDIIRYFYQYVDGAREANRVS